jgi:hypothetical protein
VHAYKFLADGRSPFTGWQWDRPAGRGPGPWGQVTGPLELCGNGVHACTTAQLPYWLGQELWSVELAGEILVTEQALVASRARLTGPVTGWDAACQARFGGYCAGRARELAAAHPADAARAGPETVAALIETVDETVAVPWVTEAGYLAAVLAGQLATGRRHGPDYDRAFAAERALQAHWLATELGLRTGAPGP